MLYMLYLLLDCCLKKKAFSFSQKWSEWKVVLVPPTLPLFAVDTVRNIVSTLGKSGLKEWKQKNASLKAF